MKTPAIYQAFQRDILPAGADLLQPDDPVTIGGHRVAGRLSSSGAGVLYLARDHGARLVTVRTAHATAPGPVRARLRAEAACARRLPATCTAPLLHDGTDETPPYLVSGHLDGPSLERVVDLKGPLPPAMVTALAADLARLLDTVHGAGVVHGNLTPGNVILTGDGPRVVDFGIAQEFASSGEPAEVGAVADNPGWLAPELLTGGPAGTACDVFGWGCLVAYAATGHSPHTDAPGLATARLGTGALDASLRSLVDAAVAEAPGERPDAAGLVAALDVHPGAAGPPPAVDPPASGAADLPSPPGRTRARAMVSAFVMLVALLIAIPAGEEHAVAPPKTPRAGAPAPATKRHRKPASNTAALSAYDRPPMPARRARTDQQQADSAAPPSVVRMSCSNRRPGWCSVSGLRQAGRGSSEWPSSWRLSWTPVP